MRPWMVQRSVVALFVSLAATAWSTDSAADSKLGVADASPPNAVSTGSASNEASTPLEAPDLGSTNAQYAMPRSRSTGRMFHPTTQSSFYIAIPIWQNIDHDVVRTGASLEGRAGYDLGFVVPEVELGFAWIPVDLDKLEPGLGRDTLSQIFVGLGVRFQARNESALTPYVSAAVDFNWWNFRETDYVCDPWYCSSVKHYRFTPGISGRAGLAVEVTPGVAIDLGVRLAMSFAGDFFYRNEWWVSPFVGFTLRF